MPSYTSSQVITLQGYINAAKAALSAGNASGVLDSLNSYYSNQTSMRGYAADALQVINNQGLFGHVANQMVIDALGATQYAAIKPTLMFQLANSDMTLILQNPNAVPTEDQIADYHAQIFKALNIPLTAWGGAAGAALASDWAQGTLTPSEIDSDLSNNIFSKTFSAAQTLTALQNLTEAGVESFRQNPTTDIGSALISAFTLYGMQTAYDLKYNSNLYMYQLQEMPQNEVPPNSTTITGSNGQFLTVVTAADGSNGIVSAMGAVTQSNGSTALYDVTRGASPIATLTATSNGAGTKNISLQDASGDPATTLAGTTIDPTEITSNLDGTFTIGDASAPAGGFVDQLTINDNSNTQTLSVTDNNTKDSSSVTLKAGSTTTIVQGTIPGTTTPSETIRSVQSSGEVDTTTIGSNTVKEVENSASTGAQIASQTVTFSNGVETGETTTGTPDGLDHNPTALISQSSGPLGADSTALLNDLAIQAKTGDPSQLFSDAPSGQSPILFWDLSGPNFNTTPSNVGSISGGPIAIASVPYSSFATSLHTALAQYAGSVFIPAYQTGAGTNPSETVASPLDPSGTLTLPTSTETPVDAINAFLSQLGDTYSGHIFYISPSDKVYTSASFLSMASDANTYTAAYEYSANGSTNYIPLFNINRAEGSVASTAGTAEDYLADPANPAATADQIIAATYASQVQPVLGTYTGASDDPGGVYGGPIITNAAQPYADDTSISQSASSSPADWADTYYDTNISYYEDDLNAYATVYTDSSTDAGYDGATDASDDFGVDFPLVINLVGAQVHTVSEQNSGVRFDVTGKGVSAPTGWITAGEGIVVRDPSDATVTSAAQFVPSFSNLARIELRRQRLSAKPSAGMEFA